VWVLLAFGVFAAAQETINYAGAGGRVTDASGAVIEGAASGECLAGVGQIAAVSDPRSVQLAVRLNW
jgi:hypothetical protein